MKNKIFLISCLCAILLFITIWTSAVIYYDPAEQYSDKGHFNTTMSYPLVSAGLARNSEVNTVVIGSSTALTVDVQPIKKHLGEDAYNLSISGASNYEILLLARTISSNPRIKHIIYLVDLFNFDAPETASFYPVSKVAFTPYISALNPNYIFSPSMFTTLKQEFLHNSKQQANGNTIPFNDATPDKYDEKRPINFNTAGHDKTMNLFFIYRIAKINSEANRKKNLQHCIQLLAENPEKHFTIIFIPYSELWWYFAEKAERIDDYLALKKDFILQGSKFKNVEFYDFQTNESTISNLSNYSDIAHFSPKVSTELIRDISTGTNKITQKNINQIYFIKTILNRKRKTYDQLFDLNDIFKQVNEFKFSTLHIN